MASGPTYIEKELVISDADGTNPRRYLLASDEKGAPAYKEQTVSGTKTEPGQKLERTWRFYPSGMGEGQDVNGGGYAFGRNAYMGRAGRVLPCPTVTSVTLTDNTTPVEWFFEDASASGTKYLYCLAGTKVFKIKLADKTLVNTKDLTGATVNFKTGSYVGTGTAQFITGLGFAPDVVVLKAIDSGAANKQCLIRTNGMTNTKLWTGTTTTSGIGITGLDEDGFSVWSNYSTLGSTYAWMAWKESAGYVDVGSYTGDGNATQAITGVGFQGDLLWIWDAANVADDAEVVSRHSTHAANQTVVYHDGATSAACVSAFGADGFTVNNDTRVNAVGHTYWYVAFKALANFLTVGVTDNGTGVGRSLTDAQLTPDVEFTPEYVIMSRYGTSASVHRSNYNSGDSSMYFSATANAADLIESLDTDGWTVGTSALVNANGVAYHFAAFTEMGSVTPIFGQPAEWNNIFHLPCGDDVYFKRLTTITDDTSDDTWTATALYAQHFAVVENALIRVREGRRLDKCTATDTTTAGNWSGNTAGTGYYIEEPAGTITQLLPVGNEVGVCTTKDFYMFDNVAVARPVLGNVVGSSTNGKGAIQWGAWTLLPYRELWRYHAGNVLPIGVDRLPLNQPIPNIDYEPRYGNYRGLAKNGGWIYAVYGNTTGTGTYILTAQPDENMKVGVKWDCLWHGTSATTPNMLFIDSDGYLWFNNGNNISYIVLSAADGSPEGGTFGTAAPGVANFTTSPYLYLPETDFGLDGDSFQLQEFEVETENALGTGAAWNAQVAIDGGVPAGVGATWTAAGATKRHWSPGTSDTGRRVRPVILLAFGTTYTATATPGILRRVTLRAVARPVSADEIEATVVLSEEMPGSTRRTPRQKYADLKTLQEAGVKRLKHPITQETVYMTVNTVGPMILVYQRNSQTPTAIATVSMRRADFTA